MRERTVLRFGRDDGYFHDLPENTRVLIVDAETRHLSPDHAGKIVMSIVQEAVRHEVVCVYKKTDSGMRGNIGMELSAALKSSDYNVLHFVPAFPELNRITWNGIHYIEGQEVAKSVFGRDPFEPVIFSDVRQIIAQQSSVPVALAKEKTNFTEGILIYDARSKEDMEQIAAYLQQKQELHLLAGCAGFASVLPRFLGIEKYQRNIPVLPNKLLTICGSINAITLQQMDVAEQKGVSRIRLSVPQKLNVRWLNFQQGKADIDAIMIEAMRSDSCIIDCDGLGNQEQLEVYRKCMGLELETMRRRISYTMGAIVKELLDRGLEAVMLITGGDTLMAFIKQAELTEMIPICEYAPGVVLACVSYHGKKHYILSKSGGFGNPKLLLELEEQITNVRRN